MDTLVGILIILASLVLIFILIGILIPTIDIKLDTFVKERLDKSWAVFTDEERLGEWLTGLTAIENISGRQNEVGSKWKLTFEENGREIEMVEEVTAFKENEIFAFNMDTPFMISQAEIRFKEAEGGTVISVLNQISGKGLFWKSLIPIMKSNIQKRNAGDYDKLRKMIES